MNSEHVRLKIYIELGQHIAVMTKSHDFVDDVLSQLKNENLIFKIDLANINSASELAIEYAKLLSCDGVDKDDINEIFGAVEQLTVGKNMKAIVVFYNFDTICRFGLDTIKKMRSIFQTHKNTVYVFVGSQALVMDTIFLNKDNAFFNFASIMRLVSREI